MTIKYEEQDIIVFLKGRVYVAYYNGTQGTDGKPKLGSMPVGYGHSEETAIKDLVKNTEK